MDLYPGVDLELTSQGGQVAPRLVAHPGADPGAIRLRVEGAEEVTTEGDHLRLKTALGEFTLPPLAVEGWKVEDANVQRLNAQTFEVLSPFTAAELANPQSQSVSPQSDGLLYSTFLGGSSDDWGYGIAVRQSGEAYVTGETWSFDFPTTPGAFDCTFAGGICSQRSCSDAFVAKVNSLGSSLVYATFLGGYGYDGSYDIAVDAIGSAYLTGATTSHDFPTTPGAFSNGGSAFVVKLNPSGSSLVYATRLGGSQWDEGWSIAVDGAGSAYVMGVTSSSDFPATSGAFDNSYNGGNTDLFVAKLNPSGSALMYAAFLGGSSEEGVSVISLDGGGNAIAVGRGGYAYVTGWTRSYDFPATSGAFDTCYHGSYDGLVAKISPSGSSLAYATFLGGNGDDWGYGIAVDERGEAYVTGETRSSDFPATSGAFDTSFNGGGFWGDAFLAKLNSSGSFLAYSTFLGGSDYDTGRGVAVDESGAAYVTGATYSSDFPTTPGACSWVLPDSICSLQRLDAFVVKLDLRTSSLVYAGLLGGYHIDSGWDIALDGSGIAYITGYTLSHDFPTTPSAFDTTHNGGFPNGSDAFVAKLAVEGGAVAYSISGRVVDGRGNPIQGVSISDNTGHTTTTGSDGRYTLGGLEAGTYTITPSKSGYTFTPALYQVTVPPDATGVDFTAIAMDVWVKHVEVTQATQDENNSVPLIAGKPTFVRVYLGCGPDGSLPANVIVELHGDGPSGELPGSPLSPISGHLSTACRESLQAQRDDLRKSLNFVLPKEWTSGTVMLIADVAGAVKAEPFSFQPARTLSIRYVPIHYDPFPLCIWLNQDPDPARIATAYQWAQKVYPTARIEYLPWPGMVWGIPLRKLACLGGADLEAEKALNFSLSLQWSLAQGPRPDYVFGWLPDEASGGGMADPRWPDWPGIGVAAHGDDDPNHGQRIFAHEIGHLLGRRHTRATSDPRPGCANLDTSPCNDWPYSTAGIQDYGVDIDATTGSTRLQRPSETYDYMSYCWYWYNLPAWTSPHTYRQIYSDTLRITGLALQSLSTPQLYFIASGLVYTDDTAVLDPIWVITTITVPQNPPAGTQYCLEAQDVSGATLASHCFDLAFLNYETGETTNVDGFNLMLPYPSDVARIVLKKGSQVLAERPVSAHAPTVTVLSPNGGEVWAATGTYTVTWTAGDPDGDPLTYSVLYSPDGSEWLPVGIGITQTQWAVNAAELAGGNNARVRVLASDGVNTSSDESDAPFTVERKGPQAFILSPERDMTVSVGTPLFLQGYSYDLEDGALPDTALHWSSSRDGDLGTGSTVLVTLSPGQHTITLTTTDNDGNLATATVDVFVGSRIYLPLVLRNH